MKATKHTVTGPVRWAEVFEENRDMEGFEGAFSDCGGAYTITVLLDEEGQKTLKNSKSAKKAVARIKEEEDLFAVKLVRKHIGPFKQAGGAPKVKWADGTDYDYEAEGPIGNGSVCEVTYEVYPTKKKINGTRLIAVKVIDHVPYEVYEEEEDFV